MHLLFKAVIPVPPHQMTRMGRRGELYTNIQLILSRGTMSLRNTWRCSALQLCLQRYGTC